MNNFKEVLKDLTNHLNEVPYNYGDLSDIGNEIGLVIGKHIKDEIIGFDKESFFMGLNHGFSITDGTHFKRPGSSEE